MKDIDHRMPKSKLTKLTNSNDNKTYTATYTFRITTRDIEEFARVEMGIRLTNHQLWMIDQMVDGKRVWFAKRSGKTTARNVLRAYVASTDRYIKHFAKSHFVGTTAKGSKFVYCPVGNICSWSEGDYHHRWCHFCQEFFYEMDLKGETQ